MKAPRVSFVVPCYKLGHLLSQCIDSILSQTCTDFEILVMNDRSPDNTAEVANSYQDDRVRHIENHKNLGHLLNYNRGIELSRGKYIWLISADDYLRATDVLEKYVALMESEPRVGYTVCPGFSVKDGQEGDMIGSYGTVTRVVQGHQFLQRLLDHNFVLAASVMVRRDCYETLGMFPLSAEWRGQPVDMGWLGDWYLWCIFALKYDVGYFAEPMVCYRQHGLSMSESITRKEVVQACADSDVGMLWMIREKAITLGLDEVSKDCLLAIANEYRRQGASKHFRASIYSLDIAHFEESLCRSTSSESERNWIRARFYDGVGNRYLFSGDPTEARKAYRASLRYDWRQGKVYGKVLLLWTGRFGGYIRKLILHSRGTAMPAITN